MQEIEREFSFCFKYEEKDEDIISFFEKAIFEGNVLFPVTTEHIEDNYLAEDVRIRHLLQPETYWLFKKSGDKALERVEVSTKITPDQKDDFMKILQGQVKLRIKKQRKVYAITDTVWDNMEFVIDTITSPMRVKMVEIECDEPTYHRIAQYMGNIDGLKRNTRNAWHYFHRKIGFAGAPSSGKAQPLTANILTPKGWKLMGDVVVGDKVITAYGGLSTVTHIFPQGEKEIYNIELEDGRIVESCEEHLWNIYHKGWKRKKYGGTTNNTFSNGERVVPLAALIEKIKTTKGTYYLPLIVPSKSENINLPIDPYIMGVLLGDGCICHNSCSITTADEDIITNVSNRLADGYILHRKRDTISYDVITTAEYKLKNKRIIGKPHEYFNNYKRILHELALFGKRGYEKFIPKVYKAASFNQKLELLKGLIDTDGYVSKTGKVWYTTTSHELATDIQSLVWSMGGVASIKEKIKSYPHNGISKKGRLSYEINIRFQSKLHICSISRKLDRLLNGYKIKRNSRLKIKSITYKGNEQAQCIVINDPSHLYVTDNYIMTHNSTLCRSLVNKLSINYGISAEQITEYARTYIARYDVPEWYIQPLIEWGQELREEDAADSVVMVTDSPRFLPYMYLMFNHKAPLDATSIYMYGKLYKAALAATMSYTDLVLLKQQDIKNDGIRYQTNSDATVLVDWMETYLKQHKFSFIKADYTLDLDKLIEDMFTLNTLPR